MALEAIRGLKTTNEIAAEFGVHTTQIGHWKKQALESLPEVFANNRGVSVNRLLWQLIEDFLVSTKYLISKDRKRSSTRGKT